MFPYAEENVKGFLENQWDQEDVKEVVTELRKLALEDHEKSVEGVVTIPGEVIFSFGCFIFPFRISLNVVSTLKQKLSCSYCFLLKLTSPSNCFFINYSYIYNEIIMTLVDMCHCSE